MLLSLALLLMVLTLVFQIFALLFGKNFVDADLGGVHLARNLGMEARLAVEERVEHLGLVAVHFHIFVDAVAHGFLLIAKGFDALTGVFGDSLQFTFLAGTEIADKLRDFGAFLRTRTSGLFRMGTLGVGR